MRVLHIITSLDVGGAEGALFRLCMHSGPSKNAIISFGSERDKYYKLLKKNGFEVFAIGNSKILVFKMILNLGKLIIKIKPTHIQTWLYHADLLGGIVAKFLGFKNIFWSIRHSNLTYGTIKNSTFLIAKLCAILSYFIPKKIISCSNTALISHKSFGYDSSKFHVVPNGFVFKKNIDIEEKSYRKILKIPNNMFLIGNVARFDPQKDHINLIKALGIVKRKNYSFHCLLAGKEIDINNKLIVDCIKDNGLINNITLLGYQDNIPYIMQSLDLHLLSSLGEAFPNVLVEAMAYGALCVSTNVGDSAMILNSNGWIAEPQNENSLANEVCKAMDLYNNDQEMWLEKKKIASDHVKKSFSIKKTYEGYYNIWNNKP